MDKKTANILSWLIAGVLLAMFLFWRPFGDAETLGDVFGSTDSRCKTEIADRIEAKDTIQFQPPEERGPVGPFHESWKYSVRYRYGGAAGVLVVDHYICGLNKDSDSIGLIPVRS